jgi:hypothetical protein
MSADIKSRIGWLVIFFRQTQRCSYETKLGKGIFGKELETLLNETNVPEINLTPAIAQARPVPFECSFNISNASDCIGWSKDLQGNWVYGI